MLTEGTRMPRVAKIGASRDSDIPIEVSMIQLRKYNIYRADPETRNFFAIPAYIGSQVFDVSEDSRAPGI